jgi:NAD(P)H-hydrate epimerase
LLGRTLSSDESENLSLVKKLATKLGATILLKSYRDLLAAPDGSTAVNSTGNPGMTVGGTGDALAGIIGAFMAQGLGAFEAACVGAWICGRAGDLCLREKGFEFLASDVIEKIPKVLMELRRVQ